MFPEEIAIVHVPGHQRGNSLETQGNNLADKAAKEAVPHWELLMSHLTPVIQAPYPCFHSPGEGSTKKLGHLPNPRRERAIPRWERNTS
jgi:hypothetical protein